MHFQVKITLKTIAIIQLPNMLVLFVLEQQSDIKIPWLLSDWLFNFIEHPVFLEDLKLGFKDVI
jgi:hypothetical protein